MPHRAARLAAIFALLLLGGTAQAQTSGSLPRGCDAKRASIVEAAYVLAEQRTAAALAFFDADPNHPHVRTWFGSGHAAKVRARLVDTLARLRADQRPVWICGDEQACDNRPIFAFADLVQRTITLCPMFFNARNDGADSRPGVLVHETSHLFASTDDLAYGRRSALTLARKEPHRAAINADNFEYFVELMPPAQQAAR
jgi:hypothetical protein